MTRNLVVLARDAQGLSPTIKWAVACEGLPQLESALKGTIADGLVLRLPAGLSGSVSLTLRMFANGVLRIPVVAIAAPHAAAYDDLRRMLLAGVDVRPVIGDITSDDIMNALDSRRSGATSYLTRELIHLVPPELTSIVLPALILGRGRTTGRELFHVVPLPSNSVRRILRQRKLPPARQIQGLSTGFHVAFDTQVHSWSLSRIAIERYFGTEDTLRQFLRRQTSDSPRTWKARGVGAALDVLKYRLARSSD